MTHQPGWDPAGGAGVLGRHSAVGELGPVWGRFWAVGAAVGAP